MNDLEIRIGDSNKFLILNEYKGELSILSAYEGSDGNTYWSMVFPRLKDKKPGDKAIPQKVQLGTPANAVRALKQMIQHIEAAGSGAGKPADDDGDIPF
jgi:hypothetical protein